jgi:hypothetical protein
LPIDDNPKQELAGIDVENYFEIHEEFYYNYCTYLFSDDLSWCLTKNGK